MDFPKSVPSVGLVDGKFVDEDPLAGTPGSLIPAQWGNSVTLEVLNVIEQSGLIPDEVDNTQLLIAVRRVIEATQSAVLLDTGVVNAYTAANPIPLTALPSTGWIQRVKIGNANSAASTYAPDGLAAKPIYGLGLQPLQGGELPAGVAVLMYLVQVGVNSGNGAWILIDSLGGALPIAPATKGRHAVQLEQVQQNYAWNHGFQAITASGNFTVPSGVYWLDVEGWGGGGGGGGSGSGGGTSGGGGAPGYFRKVMAVTPGQVIAAVIGSGGGGGGLGGGGTAGGTTTFGGTLIASGGGGGLANPSGNGGAGGSASGGDINIAGGSGSTGAATNVQGGTGGQTPGGGGAAGGGAQGGAGGGTVPGGAGGGGGSNSIGGNGARGQINIRW